MSKSGLTVPYLQVVRGTSPPDFTPRCPPHVDRILWQQFLAIDGILDGKYDQWVQHGGHGVPIPDDQWTADCPAPSPDGPDSPDVPIR